MPARCNYAAAKRRAAQLSSPRNAGNPSNKKRKDAFPDVNWKDVFAFTGRIIHSSLNTVNHFCLTSCGVWKFFHIISMPAGLRTYHIQTIWKLQWYRYFLFPQTCAMMKTSKRNTHKYLNRTKESGGIDHEKDIFWEAVRHADRLLQVVLHGLLTGMPKRV